MNAATDRRLTVRETASAGELAAAREVLDAAHQRAGFPDAQRVDRYWGKPFARTFAAWIGDQIVATDTLILDGSTDGLPCEVAFREEVWAQRVLGLSVVEGAFLAALETESRIAVMKALLAAVIEAAVETAGDMGFTAVAPHHLRLYGWFGFRCVAGPRAYPGDPTHEEMLMSLDLHHAGPTLALLRGERCPS